MTPTQSPERPEFGRTRPLSFSDFKRIINDIDETRWGDAMVYVGDDGTCPVIEVTMCSGLPAAPKGSSAARWYGESSGQPSKIEIQFTRP